MSLTQSDRDALARDKEERRRREAKRSADDIAPATGE